MKRIQIIAVISILFCAACQKEKIIIGTNVSETFYVDNAGASMRVLVEGNNLSGAYLIFVGGGPGVGDYFYNTDYIKQNIENKYAVVYWDQRNAGGSQGNANGVDLNLAQMTEDLKKVIQVLKYRYGKNIEVFILGHSFGGLLVSSFMTTADYQQMVKAWIFVDGSQNYPLNDTLTHDKLLAIGQQQIAQNKNVTNWTPIVDYCKAHTGNYSFDESNQMGTFAASAETYIDSVNQINYLNTFEKYIIPQDWPVTSIAFNYLYSSNAPFNYDLYKTQFSTSLYKIVKPVLLIFGKYDFICPSGLGDDILKRISTTDTRMVISPVSGHDVMFQDEVLFCNEVDKFIEQHR